MYAIYMLYMLYRYAIDSIKPPYWRLPLPPAPLLLSLPLLLAAAQLLVVPLEGRDHLLPQQVVGLRELNMYYVCIIVINIIIIIIIVIIIIVIIILLLLLLYVRMDVCVYVCIRAYRSYIPCRPNIYSVYYVDV